LSTGAGCDSLCRQALDVSSRIDVLINNAGIWGGFVEFVAMPEERWEEILQVDLLAPMRMTSRLLPAMIAQKRGHIVNVSSIAGLIGTRWVAPYSAAKFGLRGFGEALYAEVWQHGIDVTTVYPSFIKADGVDPSGKLRRLSYDADFVARELLKGIQQRRRHVYPGAAPKLIDSVRRFAPWALPVSRWLSPLRGGRA
jgi:short-subunit dehydrogenase